MQINKNILFVLLISGSFARAFEDYNPDILENGVDEIRGLKTEYEKSRLGSKQNKRFLIGVLAQAKAQSDKFSRCDYNKPFRAHHIWESAIKLGDIDTIERLSKYELVDSNDLYQAVIYNQVKITKMFLDTGLDVDTTNQCYKLKNGVFDYQPEELTLLKKAIFNNNLKMVKLLLSYEPKIIFGDDDLLRIAIMQKRTYRLCKHDYELFREGKDEEIEKIKLLWEASNKEAIESFKKKSTEIVKEILKYESSKDPKFKESVRYKKAFELAAHYDKSAAFKQDESCVIL